MDREVLYRGKSYETDEWFYGAYINTGNFEYIIPDPYNKRLVKICSGTAGQYVGFRDKYANRIFEGDIIRYVHAGDDGKLLFSDMQIFWNSENAQFVYDNSRNNDKSSYQELDSNFCFEVVVVGTIYENNYLLINSDIELTIPEDFGKA